MNVMSNENTDQVVQLAGVSSLPHKAPPHPLEFQCILYNKILKLTEWHVSMDKSQEMNNEHHIIVLISQLECYIPFIPANEGLFYFYYQTLKKSMKNML